MRQKAKNDLQDGKLTREMKNSSITFIVSMVKEATNTNSTV
jgi:hypothetical protein